jgi:hypothetical protein
MSTEYRAGILPMSECFQRRAKMALPPEHRVAAVREDAIYAREEWLIEGPMMPVVAPGAEPPAVMLHMSLGNDVAGVHMTAWWGHDAEPIVWRVGTWPDFATFRAAFDG